MKIKIRNLLIIIIISLISIYFVLLSNGQDKTTIKNEEEIEMEMTTFAGGCFWCMESPFEKLEGVTEVLAGYTGGHKEDPTYAEVTTGTTGHYEAVQIAFDPEVISYTELLDVFWRQINPTDIRGQFADRGEQYKTAVFYHNDEQKRLVEESKARLQSSGKFQNAIVTEILPASTFYVAEEYHQDYYKKSPIRYKLYRAGSGREAYLESTWKDEAKNNESKYVKPEDEELRNSLTPLQYKVTQDNGTERAFDNEYWNNKKEGIYVDVVSGEPLFSSSDKFKSGTGWPSFTKPLEPDNVLEKEDNSLFISRTEVRSKNADSHLGHLFNNGTEPTGLSYCMNSASLRFIPKEDLEKEGYGQYKKLFE